MQKVIKYVIFGTKWGYFGLAGAESALCRAHLPGSEPDQIKSLLLRNLPPVNPEENIKHQASRCGHRASKIEHQVSRIESRDLRIELDRTFFKMLQEQIAAYFEGNRIDFGPDIPVVLDGFSDFGTSVLSSCRDVKFGQTISYAELAKKSGRSGAGRAVGNALAKNPLPLIIPCHRVIRGDGKMGGFSAPGGISLKKKMLDLEHQALKA